MDEKPKSLVDRINSVGQQDAPTGRFYGTGIGLMDYRKVGEHEYEATRWLTILYVPVAPGPTWRIRPISSSYIPALGVMRQFDKLGEVPTPRDRIIRMYVVGWSSAVASIVPLVLVTMLMNRLPGWLQTPLILAAFVPPMALLIHVDKQEARAFDKEA